MDPYDEAIRALHDRLNLDWTAPLPSPVPVRLGQRVSALVAGPALAAGIVTDVVWRQRPQQCPYDHPPQWRWEWYVSVTTTEEVVADRWHEDWASLAERMWPETASSFEQTWRRLEAEREPEIINGCPVILTFGDAKIIEHPMGFMAYRSSRLGIRQTLDGAIKLAARTA